MHRNGIVLSYVHGQATTFRKAYSQPTRLGRGLVIPVRMTQISGRLDERPYPLFEALQLDDRRASSLILVWTHGNEMHNDARTHLWEPTLDLPIRDQEPPVFLFHNPLGHIGSLW